jgi:hypothetical protein
LIAVGEEAELAALAVLVEDVNRVLPGIERVVLSSPRWRI